MADRYRLASPRKGSDGKTYWTSLGVMFPMKDKDGFSIIFEALPIPTLNDRNELECRVMAFDATEDKPGDHNKAKGNGYQQQPLDDNIPF